LKDRIREMKCSQCQKTAAVELKYSKQFLCEAHFTRLFEKRVRRTIRKNKLLRYDDKIAVALSGGKDSSVLLKILNELTKKVRTSSLFAITIDEGIAGYSENNIEITKKFCGELGIEHYIFSFKDETGITMDDVVNKIKNSGKAAPPCSYCGVFRRNLLNIKAREMGATKIATGHNLDDECQVMFMNFIRGDLGRIARMGTYTGIIKNEKFVPKIKPLRECPEDEVRMYAILNELEINSERCPYSRYAFRETVRNCLNGIEEKHPGSKFQALKSIDELIPIMKEVYKTGELPNKCEICGELTSGRVCKFCEIMGEFQLL